MQLMKEKKPALRRRLPTKGLLTVENKESGTKEIRCDILELIRVQFRLHVLDMGFSLGIFVSHLGAL
jgi:hypothetical protein